MKSFVYVSVFAHSAFAAKNTILMHLIYRLAAVQRLLRCFVIQCTLSRGSLYEVIFSDIIIIITIMITIICLFAAVVPPMEGTTDSVHFGQNKVVKLRRKIFPLVRPKCCLKLLFKCLDGHNSTLGGPICKSRDIFGILMKRGFSQAQTIHDFTKNLNKNSV